MIRPAQLAGVAVPLSGRRSGFRWNRQSRIKIRDATSSFSTPRRRSATSHTPDGNAALPERMNAESFRHRARRANRATVRFDRTPAVERGAARGSCVWNPVAIPIESGRPRLAWASSSRPVWPTASNVRQQCAPTSRWQPALHNILHNAIPPGISKGQTIPSP